MVLIEIQKQNDKELSLIQDVKTRWNSVYYMVERVLEIKDSLIIAITKIEAHLPIFNKEEWDIAQDLVNILSPVEAATRTLCGDKYTTSSLIIPTIRALINT